ncbi:ABC-three component system protein [Brevibacillus marinus]|uniref:ABC-three component system protein n=1 Tax=Brevibacillus marinus TaxID=2496837 RepID=UPI000F827319|nr:ABC-three component system protein [Brevibacillus marinus]
MNKTLPPESRSSSLIEQERMMTHDATSSWNGYSHQGKAALYTVLAIINDQDWTEQTASEYELELEYMEDFTILHKGEPIAIHQVKTYNSTSPSLYQDAIWTLLGKTAMTPTIKKAYLHTTEKLTSKAELLERLKKPKRSQSKNAYYYYNYVKKKNCYQEVSKKFELYEYEQGQHYCPLDKIHTSVIGQIRKYCDKRGIKRSEGHFERAFYFLLAQLDKHIAKRHHALQEGTITERMRRIPFLAILEPLNQNFEEATKEYYIFRLREEFTSVCEQFLYKYQDEKDSAAYQRVEMFIRDIHSLDDQTFIKLCKKWTPHIRANEINLETFRGLIPSNGVRDPLLKSIFVFRAPIQDKSVFLKRNETGQNIVYLPTTINEKPTSVLDDDLLDDKEVGRIAKDILQNSDVDDLHEVDVIISSHIPMDSIWEAASKFTSHLDEPKNAEDSNRDYEKFMKIKKIRMTPFKDARRELE